MKSFVIFANMLRLLEKLGFYLFVWKMLTLNINKIFERHLLMFVEIGKFDVILDKYGKIFDILNDVCVFT